MPLQKLIEEREKLTSEKIPEIMGLEVSPDGTDNQLCIRDEDDDIVESIDFSDEVKELKQFHAESLQLVIDGVVEIVQKICIEKKVTNDFAKRHPESYKYELGWDAALDEIISQLQTLESIDE